LKADYYNGLNFDEYVGTQYVSKLDFYFDHKAPIEDLVPDNCSIIYTGLIKSPLSGEITFSARVDDGIMVYIDETKIISNWQLNDVGISEGKIFMEADKYYKITIKYFNAMNEAELRLLWTLPEDDSKNWFQKFWDGDGEAVTIPAENFLVPEENGRA